MPHAQTRPVAELQINTIPASITILDSEGYTTARPRLESPTHKASLEPIIRVLDTFADASSPRNPRSSQSPPRASALQPIDPQETMDKLEAFARELELKKEELRKSKELVEAYGKEMNKLRRNHVYELRLLQKAILNLRTRKKGQTDPNLDLTERIVHLIKERDAESARCQKLEGELQEERALHAALASGVGVKFRSPRDEGNLPPERSRPKQKSECADEVGFEEEWLGMEIERISRQDASLIPELRMSTFEGMSVSSEITQNN